MTATRDRVLAIARREIGTGERADGTSKYGSWYERAKPAPGFAAGAWCQMFLAWAANEAGLPESQFPRLAYTPYAVAWFKDRKRWGSKPQVGALVYYNFPGGDFVDHVEIVEAVRSDGSIVTIGGNVANRVQRLVRRSNIAGYGYPDYGSQITEDDMPNPKDLWHYELKVPFGSPENPEWQAGNVLVNAAKWVHEMRARLKEMDAKLDAQNATIKALAEALAVRDGSIDPDALIDRIRTELDNVTIQLSVGK